MSDKEITLPSCARCGEQTEWCEVYKRFDDGFLGGWVVKSRAFFECPGCGHKMPRPDGKGLLDEDSPIGGNA